MHKVVATLCAAITAIGAAFVAVPAIANTPVDGEQLSRAFFKTVFGLEYDGGHADAYRVKRYVGQVRFHVEDLSGLQRAALAESFLTALPQRIQHLRATVVRERERANFRVIIVRDQDFAAVVSRELKADTIAMNARCLVGVTTRNGRIERSTAVIIADDDFLFPRCLVEEVLQGLGPMNDDDSLTESVFNDSSHHASFTPFDEALMNVLYHPMIRPGMSSSQAQKALPAVLQSLGYRR
ncbi:DUF2927 domain-containing protein [Acuticoccus sp. M5D2P5]|uniref:DUF2927 domain-containing protein n=1 Tax=Acuticoccus kalidii TaxID=2910977 RepID=UPI001F1B1922|nr:DUF2927 domain-containing protein [Acuticoccus kalidii]MCF3933796.1 DUF2927 domain-containing protein [Acuticoccus kalidii]